MPSRDHTGIVLSSFNGLWNRGDIDNVPADHFSDLNNIKFVGQSAFGTRDGIGISQNVTVPLINIKRIYNYPTQTANTLIVLTWDGTTGNVYHCVSATLVYGPILTITGMSDIALMPYAGRAFISPFSSSLPQIDPPLPLTAALAIGGGIDAGVHNYAVTFVISTGETTPSNLTTVTTIAALTNPSATPVISDLGIGAFPNNLVPGATYKWKFTYAINGAEYAISGGETLPSPASLGLVAPAITHLIGMNYDTLVAGIPAGATLNVYRTLANGSTYYQENFGQSIGTTNVAGVNYIVIGLINDTVLAEYPFAPVANGTQYQKVNLSSIPLLSNNASATVLSRNIYRTAANGSQLKLLTTLADDTTTVYVDTTADSGLGANAPVINTATYGTTLIDIGLSGQFLYIYNGDGTQARPAAGPGMTGTMTVANGGPGYTDAGLHIFGFVSETSSGYYSPPTILTAFTTDATNAVSFGNIPTSGNANVIARLLVSTIVIDPTELSTNPNLSGYEFFFVPNAIINNNTDTFLNNISFYDADLLQDASYLLNEYTSIPAGAVLTLYHNRLCLATTSTDISLILVSQPGQPESIDQISGLIVFPLDGNPITNAQEMRDVLYVFKRAKTVAYADNGDVPSSWPLTTIDNALGTCVHGIATVLDSGTASVDALIICTYQGVSQFNGKYMTPELSYKIIAFWQQLNRLIFDQIQIVNGPVQKQIYIVTPAGNMLVGYYGNGLDYKNIKWSHWTFTMPLKTVAIQNISDIILGMNLI